MSYIPIVLAFTPNYIIPAATTIVSVLESSQNTDTFEIICLSSSNLSQEIRESLVAIDKKRLRFKFINLENQLEGIYVDERYTVAASYRLLLPNILSDYDVIIYLDCDIIVRNNLANLYHSTNLGDNYLAAVYEASLTFQIPYLNKIGCIPGAYFNSGFLMMNLNKMREDDIVPELIRKLDNPNSDFPDQDALNIVCANHILGLSPVYNSIRTFFLPQYKTDFLKYYSLDDWDSVQKHGTIHYTGVKPWNGYTVKFEIWWKYYEKLPENIKKLGVINNRLFVLAKALQYPVVKWTFDLIQAVYRKLKK